MITSAQNPRLKLARSLMERARDRRAAGAFIGEGVRLVEEAMAAGWPFQFVLAAENLSERGIKLVSSLQGGGIPVEQVSSQLMENISATETSQGILAVLELSSLPLPKELTFALVPDQVRDPGNLGTLLRTAAAAGVQAVLLPPETTDAFSPKVVRAGMGAHFHLPVRVMGWDAIQETCQAHHLSILLADMDGIPLWEADLGAPLALVIGGEAEGASAPARRLAKTSLTIPMPGGSESLNAAAAGAILMFEVVRQRSTPLHPPTGTFPGTGEGRKK